MQAMLLGDQKVCSQDPPLPRPHLRVGSGNKSNLLEIPVYLRPSEGKQFLSFISVSQNHSIMKSQNILSWKGSTRIVESVVEILT